MSNSEMAVYLEKETLRDAEDSDYQLMRDLIKCRIHPDADPDDVIKYDNNAFFMTTSSENEIRPVVSPLILLMFRNVVLFIIIINYSRIFGRRLPILIVTRSIYLSFDTS